MTPSDYKNEGFQLSQYIEQGAISRAEADVLQAYIVPILGHTPTAEELASVPVRAAIMNLAFLLIMQRTAVATRAGGKQKMTAQSTTPTYEDILQQNAPVCVMKLQTLAGTEKVRKKVNDICGLFFVSRYFNNK